MKQLDSKQEQPEPVEEVFTVNSHFLEEEEIDPSAVLGTLPSGSKFILHKLPNAAGYCIKLSGNGALHKSLEGTFTSPLFAEQAVTTYLGTR